MSCLVTRSGFAFMLLVVMASCETPKGPAASAASGARFSFEAGELGKSPPGWHVAETAGTGRPAVWSTERIDGASAGPRAVAVTAANGGSTFNLLLSDASYPGDVALTVQVKARTGEVDQGGGLVWRARDANHYYVARWNPLENNLRLYKVDNGTRTMFASAAVHADPAAWHRLAVAMRGASITVAFDGKELLRHSDSTFPGGGQVGLWTKADASTVFSALEITPLSQ